MRQTSEIDRLSTEREKTGVFLQRYAINPVNGERLPIYAADYVLADYGTARSWPCPAHDQRDLDFARAFDLPVRVVVASSEDDPADVRGGDRRRRRARQLRPTRRAGQGRRDRAHHRAAGEQTARAPAPSTTGCATG